MSGGLLQRLVQAGTGRSFEIAASPFRVAAIACTTAAIRTAACIDSTPTPALRSSRSCASTHIPQPLIAETASDHSSKSAFHPPASDHAFMRASQEATCSRAMRYQINR